MEIIWLLGGICIGIIIALILGKSRRGDAALDKLLNLLERLIGQYAKKDN